MAQTQNSKQTVEAPQAGQTVIVNAIPGQDIVLDAAFEQAEVKMDDGNVIFEFANGGQVVIDFTNLGEAEAPNVVMPDGTILGMEEFLASLGDGDIEPAAGPAAGAAGSGGVGEYREGAGDLIDGTDKLDGLDPREFSSIVVPALEANAIDEDVNPVPAAGIVAGAVDEDGLKEGVGDSSAPFDHPAQLAFAIGNLSYDFGGDGPAASDPFTWNLDGLVDKGVKSQGNLLQYEVVDGVTLNAYYMGNPDAPESGYEKMAAAADQPGVTAPSEKIIVFTLELTDLETGEYRFELFRPLDHSESGAEDDILYNFTFTLTDGNGDSVEGGLNIIVDDDSPIWKAGEANVSAIVVEEAMSYEDGDLSEGNNDGFVAQMEAGAMTQGAIEAFLGITSGGLSPLAASGEGDDNATNGSAMKTTIMVEAGDQISFSWSFSANDYKPYNDFSFVTINGVPFELADISLVGDYNETPWATYSFVAADTGPLTLGFGVMNVRDNSMNSYLSVDDIKVNGVTVPNGGFENGNFSNWLTLGDPDLITNALFSDEASGLSGTLAALVSFGGDGPGEFAMLTDTSELPTLFSKGEQVQYIVEGDTLIAYVGEYAPGSGEGDYKVSVIDDGGYRVVFTLQFNPDGSWYFDLQDQLDHIDDGTDTENFELLTGFGEEGAVGVPAIDFSSLIKVTDGDGDVLNGAPAGSFTIAIQDDVPVVTVGVNGQALGNLNVSLDETVGGDRYNSDIPEPFDEGNDDDLVSESDPLEVEALAQVRTSIKGGLAGLFLVGGDVGADEPGDDTVGTFSFEGFPDGGGLETLLSVIGGGHVTLFLVDGVIVGSETDDEGKAVGDPVFTIEIVESSEGSFQLETTLFRAIDHGADRNFHDAELALHLAENGAVQLKYEVSRTDYDGDTVTESRAIDLISRETKGEGEGEEVVNKSYFSFDDDGPIASVAPGVTVAVVTVDESPLDNPSTEEVKEGDGLRSASADFTSYFVAPNPGSDGVGSVGYALQLTGPDATSTGVASGLYAVDASKEDGKGDMIMLFQNSETGVVEGRAGGQVFFTISVDNNPASTKFGFVTFSQLVTEGEKSVWHGNTDSHDDSSVLTIAQGEVEPLSSLQLIQTVTDGDGDTDQARLDLSGVFLVEDDGPLLTSVGNLDIENEPGSYEAGIVGLSYGSDGGVLTISQVTEIDGITVTQSEDGKSLTATFGSGDVFYKVGLKGDGSAYTFELVNPQPSVKYEIGTQFGRGGAPVDEITVQVGPEGKAFDVTFDGLLFDASGDPVNTDSNFERLNPNDTGFGVGSGNVENDEGFEVRFDSAVNGLEFDIVGAGGNVQSANVVWEAFDADGHKVDSGLVPITGLGAPGNSEGLTVGILSDADFVRLQVRVELPESNDSVRVEDFAVIDVVTPPDLDLQFKATVTDGDGDSVSADFTVSINGGEPPALSTMVWNDSNNNGLLDSVGDHETVIVDVKASAVANDPGTENLFIGQSLSEGRAITSAQLASNPPANTVLEVTSDIVVTFLSEGAGYQNAVGWYDVKDPGVGHIIWSNASASGSGGSLVSGSSTVTLNDVQAGTQLGWFLIPNAFSHQNNLPSDGTVYFKDGQAYRDAGHSQLITSVGNENPTWFSNGNNDDGLQHVITGVVQDESNMLYVGFEDLEGGGDKDYNDVIFKVDLGEGNSVQVNPAIFDVGAEIHSTESDTIIKSASLTFTLGAEDTVFWTPVSGLDVHKDGDVYTITGDATIASYNELLDSFVIQVGNSGINQDYLDIDPQTRTAILHVTDVDGNSVTSNAAVFDLQTHITGGHGDDVLVGGEGDDVLAGGPGDDDMTGGLGGDVFMYTDGDLAHVDDGDIISDFKLGEDQLDLSELLDDGVTRDNLSNYLHVEGYVETGDAATFLLKVDANGAASGPGFTDLAHITVSGLDVAATDEANVLNQMLDHDSLKIG